MVMRPPTILKITAKYEKLVVQTCKAMAISWKQRAALDEIGWSEPCLLFRRLDLAPEKGQDPTTHELEDFFHFSDYMYGKKSAVRKWMAQLPKFWVRGVTAELPGKHWIHVAEGTQLHFQKSSSGPVPVFLAYFFCGPTSLVRILKFKLPTC